MKNLTFKAASAALAMALCFGASASASMPVALAPVSNNLSRPSDIIIVTGPHYVVIVTRATQQAKLENVNPSAQFDSVN